MSSENNKRIAKNTAMLYFRMLFTMAVSLYTSRIVLNTLGVEDFGIYNVVGGVVVLFSFLNSSLTQATQRFLTFELGKKDMVGFNNIFNLSLLLYLAISIAIIILAETLGLWLLNTQLNIQSERIIAANWAYQFTIVTFVLNMMRTPYNAAIIAFEKMSFYAYISIIEVILKLLIVYILVFLSIDKLILYSILLSVVSFIILIIFIFYIIHKFNYCRLHFFWDVTIFKKMASFSGWTLFGSLSVMSATQGVNMLLNIFFGVVVNAAVGISNQVAGAVQNFVTNFQLAFNPQITKSYASDNREYLMSLIFNTSKYSLFLISILVIPLLIKTEAILKLWLGIVPDYAVIFSQLTLISLVIESISGPLWMTVQATGKIKKYQIYISGIKFIEIIGALIFFKLGFNPTIPFIIRCILSFILLFLRLFLLKDLIKFPIRIFIQNVVIKNFVVCGSASIISYYICNNFYSTFNLNNIVGTTITSIIITIVLIYIFGLNKSERRFIINKLAMNKSTNTI